MTGNSRRTCAMAVVGVLALGLSTGAGAAEVGLRIENVSADRVAFRPERGEQLSVRFRLSAAAEVELRVYDSRDLLIRAVRGGAPVDAGDRALVWDGRSDRGQVVPPEAYFYTLAARPAQGDEVVYDVTDLTRGEDTALPNLAFDPQRRTLSYTLPGPARVGIRVGLEDSGALLATVVNWEPRVGLAVEERIGGLLEVADNALAFHGQYFRLPDNAIVVRPPSGESYARRFVSVSSERRQRQRRGRHMYRHSEHARDQCYDFPVNLEFARGVAQRRDGLPVLGRGAMLRVDVPAEHRAFVENQRFETVLYLDGVFITELEQGYIPFQWPLDPIAIPASEHVLTVNLRGYEGHFGCESIRFVQEASTAPAGSPVAREESP